MSHHVTAHYITSGHVVLLFVLLPLQVNYVVKAGIGFQDIKGMSAATEVVSSFVRTSFLWEMIRVQVGAVVAATAGLC
jgi:hypothetical protein